MLFYAIVKFLAYTLWCFMGLRLLSPARATIPRAIAFGAVRWMLGLLFGVAVAILLGSIDGASVVRLYFGIYAPLRVVEWWIMVALMRGAHPAGRALSRDPKIWGWVVGGIALSFLSDLASPEGMEGRFCMGRCLC